MNALPYRQETVEAVETAERQLQGVFARIDRIEQQNQWKVLSALKEERVAQRHFAPTTGYGYDDIGRDTLERVFARALGAEDALVRPQIASGTHALYLALSGLLAPGDKLLAVTGPPYDTLQQAISGGAGSLAEFGVGYEEIMLAENSIDLASVRASMEREPPKVVYAQRSRGYAWREAFCIDHLRKAFAAIRAANQDVIIMVDNCYGEFTETEEPLEAGADVIAGSLIKNPGGGLAPTGGYLAGRAKLIERISYRMTVPGLGREVGSYAASYLPYYQGLFMAPHVTAQGLKTAALFARMLENEGMTTMPHSEAKRSDIIQALRFTNKDDLVAFIQSIQKAAPVDSFVQPEPWDMPGYTHQVIMAAGAFIQGASIEMSADAPIREPYIAYIQGALTYAHGKLAAMLALETLRRR